jgi:hypothetical protein
MKTITRYQMIRLRNAAAAQAIQFRQSSATSPAAARMTMELDEISNILQSAMEELSQRGRVTLEIVES